MWKKTLSRVTSRGLSRKTKCKCKKAIQSIFLPQSKWVCTTKIFFSLSLNNFFFNFLLFQFSRENGWKSVYGNGILCLKAVKFALWNNSQLCNVIGCADCQSTCFHSSILSCVGVPFPSPRVPGVPASSRTFFYFFTRMYSYVTLMLLVCTRMWLVCYPYVLVCIRMLSVCTLMYSYVTRM